MLNDMLGTVVRKLVTLPIEILGIVCDLLEKMSNPEWVEATKKFLRKESPWKISQFKIWKTIKLGTGLKTADDFRKALKADGYQIGSYTDGILGKPAFTAATKETEVELVKVSVEELGFKNGATRQEIYQRAQELGLKLCPNEVGPQLCLQYKNQPNNEWLMIAMEPILGFDGYVKLFDVGHNDDVRWLRSAYGNPDSVWNADDQFVFCK